MEKGGTEIKRLRNQRENVLEGWMKDSKNEGIERGSEGQKLGPQTQLQYC